MSSTQFKAISNAVNSVYSNDGPEALIIEFTSRFECIRDKLFSLVTEHEGEKPALRYQNNKTQLSNRRETAYISGMEMDISISRIIPSDLLTIEMVNKTKLG